MSSQPAETAAPISDEVALQVCKEISAANRGKWYTFNGIWCYFCARFSATPEQRCFANAKVGGNQGCGQVNARFAASTRATGSR